jgi:hypothetical protein
MKRIVCALLLLSLCLPFSLFAQDQSSGPYRHYEMGSQIFTFRAGVLVPTFFYRPNDEPPFLAFGQEMHMKVGGYGSIRYQGFLTRTLALGGELGYIFAYDDGQDLYTSVPMQAKLTYIPLQGKFEIPLSLGLGFAYNSYAGENKPTYMSFLATAEAGFSWYFKEDWGITLSAGLQLIPELYFDSHPIDSTLAAFMPITLSISYRSN